jgi:hypothetical protein
LGSQARQGKDAEEFEKLVSNMIAMGQTHPITVRRMCRFNPLADLVPQDGNLGDYKAVNNGHTRIEAIASAEKMGIEKFERTGQHTTDVLAYILPSFEEAATAKLLSAEEAGIKIPSEEWEEEMEKVVNELILEELSGQASANLQVGWSELDESINNWNMFKKFQLTASSVSDPFKLRKEGQTPHQYETALVNHCLEEVSKLTGRDAKFLRENIKLSDPEVTPEELQEAFKEGLITKSMVVDLRRIGIKQMKDKDGNVTNQEEVDNALEVREQLLGKCISGDLNTGQLRTQIKRINAGTKIKDKSRASLAKAIKVVGLSEDTASAWIEELDKELEKVTDDQALMLIGAIAALRAATAPTEVDDIPIFILEEGEELMSDVEEDVEVEAEVGD